ncbi:MAG: IS30 family transposase [Bacteroidetes bacterium]|nr:IS30 family transposase [Bacteroidota bacterium]
MKKYSRVSYEDRCQISAMLKRNFLISEIATELGFDKSTIYREIKRNKDQSSSPYRDVYNPLVAQSKANKRSKNKGRPKIIQGNVENIIIEKMGQGWSPEKIAGRFKKEKFLQISHQTIYSFIYENNDYKKLLRFGRKRGIGRRRQASIRKEKLLHISQRPISANNRSRMGHWERDGMYGANKKQLLVCIERKTRLVRIEKMNSTRAQDVHNLTSKALKKDKVLSITNDNGTEFRRPHLSKYPIYYCDPMKPNQRGSVENVIGSLRRLVKRTTDLEKMTDKRVKEIESYINNTPLKMFDYQTPYEVYYKKKVALIV